MQTEPAEMKVVVTGGAGFIGANLCRRLASTAGVGEVVAFDDLSTGLESNLDGVDVDFERGSILDPRALDRVLVGASSVVHLAARPSVPRSLEDPLATHTVNVTGTVQVLEAARRAQVRHLVVASSSSVYGANPTLPKHEELLPQPLNPYAASKLAGESYSLAFARSFDLEVLVLRFFNVFGPLQRAGHAYAAVVPAFVESALAGRPLPLHGDGTQTRDFTFVGSVCAVLADAVTRRVSSPGPVNLAFGCRHSLLEVIESLESLLDRTLSVERLARRKGDIDHSQADTTRLRALFPGSEPVPFEEGLRETVAWFAQVSEVQGLDPR